nr:MAG TPA: hypothetical protein [Caudoviricetes sp.]
MKVAACCSGRSIRSSVNLLSFLLIWSRRSVTASSFSPNACISVIVPHLLFTLQLICFST